MPSKWMETMIKKHGSEEAVKAYMAELARKQKGIKKPNSGVASLSKAEQSKRGTKAANARWNKENKS
jgi:hypothetical protein